MGRAQQEREEFGWLQTRERGEEGLQPVGLGSRQQTLDPRPTCPPPTDSLQGSDSVSGSSSPGAESNNSLRLLKC